MVSRFDPDLGTHPIYTDVKSDYQRQRKAASNYQSVALGLTIAAGVALGAGIVLLQVDRKQNCRKYACAFTARGYSF